MRMEWAELGRGWLEMRFEGNRHARKGLRDKLRILGLNGEF